MNSIQYYGNFNVNQNYGKVRKSPNFKAIPEPLKHPEKLFNNEIKKPSLEELIREALKRPEILFKNEIKKPSLEELKREVLEKLGN